MTDRRDTRNALNGEVLNVQLRHTAALAYDPAGTDRRADRRGQGVSARR
ncbi:hypothetical protein [Micromonospora cremea]|nr:hypothetical protein [Micromonospora cremea]